MLPAQMGMCFASHVTLSGLFSPNIIGQPSCKILTTHAKTWPILHDDWSIRLGENRPNRALMHLAAMLVGYTVNPRLSGQLGMKFCNNCLDKICFRIIEDSNVSRKIKNKG